MSETIADAQMFWRTKWLDADYSWDGLKDIPWAGWSVMPDGAIVERAEAPPGARWATLQDYWRDEEPKLIEGDGKRWTRAHCPLAWNDGTPTPKAKWNDAQRLSFQGLLQEKIAAAAETKFHGVNLIRKPDGSDRRAQFNGCVLFAEPRPPGGATALSARFEAAYFAETANFSDLKFVGDTGFYSAMFGGDAIFLRTVFEGTAGFEHVVFAKALNMDGARFLSEASFAKAYAGSGARFESTSFDADARFTSANFRGYAGFSNARFAGIAHFDATRFCDHARFNRASFESEAAFDGAFFEGVIDFRHAVFLRPAMFVGARFPAKAEAFSAAFRGARFGDVADFTGAGGHFVAAFDEAILDRKLLLDEVGDGAADRKFQRAVFQSIAASQGKAGSRRGADSGEMRERLLRELEGGCRAVKVALGRDRDEAMEQRYYRYQLIARRKQRATPLPERLYSHLYGTFSDYGMGLWQPFATLLTLTLGFGVLYWVWGAALQGEALFEPGFDQNIWDALQLSANNVFRPFGVWSSEFNESAGSAWARGFLRAFDQPNEAGQRLAIRLVATLQSIFAVVLFFLFALAVRRRFQIGT